MSINLEPYLAHSRIIDWKTPKVLAKAEQLKSAAGLNGSASDELLLITTVFNYVRDEISHSTDAQASVVTCKASEVLAHQTGFCFAKSHLLAALLRANGIYVGFSYQRLSLGNGQFCLHGLNSVYLSEFGWHKVDARGNNERISTHFAPPKVSLAFDSDGPGEQSSLHVYQAPLEVIAQALELAESVDQLDQNLPDQILAN